MSRNLQRKIITLGVTALLAPFLLAAGCEDSAKQQVWCSPSDAKNFSAKPACNLKTVGGECSMEHRRDRAATTGAPVVCVYRKTKGLHWEIDIRPIRDHEWKAAKIAKPARP